MLTSFANTSLVFGGCSSGFTLPSTRSPHAPAPALGSHNHKALAAQLVLAPPESLLALALGQVGVQVLVISLRCRYSDTSKGGRQLARRDDAQVRASMPVVVVHASRPKPERAWVRLGSTPCASLPCLQCLGL